MQPHLRVSISRHCAFWWGANASSTLNVAPPGCTTRMELTTENASRVSSGVAYSWAGVSPVQGQGCAGVGQMELFAERWVGGWVGGCQAQHMQPHGMMHRSRPSRMEGVGVAPV